MSILDNENDLINDNEAIVRRFIEENYKAPYITIRKVEDGFYEVDGNTVIITNTRIKRLTNGFFRWGNVNLFRIENCTALESLEGGPRRCVNMQLQSCLSLTSLKGSPEECVTFDCRWCESLKSLEGAPKCLMPIDLQGCFGLRSLEGAPKDFMRQLIYKLVNQDL